MLTALAVSDVLRTAFPRNRVQAVLDQMVSVGMVKRGPTTGFSPHDACVAAVACAQLEPIAGRALATAMRARDYVCQALQPHLRTAQFVDIADLKNIRAIRVMIAEICTRQPGPYWISQDEIANPRLRFWAAGGGERALPQPPSAWVLVPQSVFEGFARHNELVNESLRRDNELLLARLAESVRPALAVMPAAERNRRHRAKLAEAEAEAAE